MVANYVFNLEILFLVFLVFTRASLGEECDSSGINCISCTSYQRCDGGNPVGPVLKGYECDQNKLEQCRVKYNCYGLNECTQAGVFPDAEDESNYYVCLNDPTAFVKYEFRCVEGEFFDKSTLMCIPKAATLTGSDTSSSLGDATEETESTSEGSSTSSTGTTTSTPPSTISTTAAPFVCPAPGIFPSPSNCKMYHRCSSSLKLFNYVCPGTSYFNENLLKCSMIITPTCQAQISQNSSSTVTTPTTTPATTTTSSSTTSSVISTTTVSTTTTALPTPTTEATTTTTPPTPTTEATTTTSPSATTLTTSTTTASTTTTTTTTPLPTSPVAFSCPMLGTFSSPNDCKTYYRCSTSGKSFVYTCPGETYFNEFTKRCSLQITPRCQKLLQR